MPSRPSIAAVAAIAALIASSGCSTETNRTETTRSAESAPSPDASGPLSSDTGAAGYTGPALAGLTTDDWQVDVITDELEYPWEVQHAEGTFVVTEIAGTIVMIDDAGLERFQLHTSNPIVHEGGSGLLGMVLAENFRDSRTAYVYYTYAVDDALMNRVAEITFDGSGWQEKRVLVDGIPGHNLYNGGRLGLGPDGHLYVTTGWVHDADAARDISNLGGKILRVDLSGNPVEGNATDGSVVFSLGHRNPQGLDWNDDGTLYVAEHGESANDEINIVTAGSDYGWPTVEGDAEQEGLTSPFLHSDGETWAPSGAAFAGDEFLVAALRGAGLYLLNDATGEMEMIFTSDERVRAVLPHQDSIYITTTNTSPRGTGANAPDRLLRLTPAR